MQNVDMNIIEFFEDDTYSLIDTFSTGYTLPSIDESRGGKNNLEVISFISSPKLIYKRKFNTGDKHDAIVPIDSQITISVAWGSGKLSYHGMNHLTTSICIGKNDCKASIKYDFWSFHGTILTFMWTILSFIGYVSARFFKHLPFWIYLHLIGSIIPSIITFVLLLFSMNLSNLIFI